ncbi:MAG: hypothetical protein ABJ275_09635 [Maricaulaceae bacterium]
MSTGNLPTTHPTIGMGILSWRGAASLEHALSTYESAGLFDLFDERVIILPEPDGAVKSIAAHHPLQAHEFPKNLGIAGGMQAVAEALTTDYVLFLENDCPLIASLSDAKAQLELSLQALEAGVCFIARLRSRLNPGELFTTLPKYERYWGDGLTPKMRRALRPAKASRLSGTAVYSVSHPHERHPDVIKKYSENSYIVSPKAMPWTNQSILMKRRDFLDVILPYVLAQPLSRAVNGFHNVEIELNRTSFWVNSNFGTLCPKGLFTHKRFGDRGYR